MCPGVVRLEYHLHDNGDEVSIIRCSDGSTRRVDVTGLNLQQSVDNKRKLRYLQYIRNKA